MTVAAVGGNAGAGGCFLARTADFVWVRDGVILNPHYKNMGNLFGSEFWTYLLPPRVGAEGARAIMRRRLPMTAQEAVRLGFYDACLPGAGICRRCRAAGCRVGGSAAIFQSAWRRSWQGAQADEASKPLSRVSGRGTRRNAPQFLRLRSLVPCRALSFRGAHRRIPGRRVTSPATAISTGRCRNEPIQPAPAPAVLVIDDEVRSQEALRRTLEEDFEVFAASGAAEGMEILEREQSTAEIRIVLCDQRMPGMTGRRVPEATCASRWPDVVRIILSGYTDAEDIIAGVNEAGIWQYLLKPWQPEQLLLTLQRAAEVWRLQQENQRLSLELRTAEPVLRQRVESKQREGAKPLRPGGLIRAPGQPARRRVCDMIARVAPYDLSVLITGESGTGKELVARAIHYESPRADKAFVTENCGALPDTLLESELFGHKRGAFTGAVEDRVGLFQQADGGTLFLDEIGETSPGVPGQAAARAAGRRVPPARQQSRGDGRCAGHRGHQSRPGGRRAQRALPRGSLLPAGDRSPLHVPPLRERPMDIPLLAERLLESQCSAAGQDRDRLRDRRAGGCSPPITGRATCANCRTRSCAWWRWPTATDNWAPNCSRRASCVPPRPTVSEPTAAWADGLAGSLKERMEQLETRVLKEAHAAPSLATSRAPPASSACRASACAPSCSLRAGGAANESPLAAERRLRRLHAVAAVRRATTLVRRTARCRHRVRLASGAVAGKRRRGAATA